MAKSRIFQVISNRFRFICSDCKAKRSLPVPPNVRRRSVRCHKCGVVTQCQLNRRLKPREMQSGKAIMIARDGNELEIDLRDISLGGVGFDAPFGALRKIALGQEVQLRCNWNPRLLDRGRYRVISIKGQRVGVKRFT